MDARLKQLKAFWAEADLARDKAAGRQDEKAANGREG